MSAPHQLKPGRDETGPHGPDARRSRRQATPLSRGKGGGQEGRAAPQRASAPTHEEGQHARGGSSRGQSQSGHGIRTSNRPKRRRPAERQRAARRFSRLPAQRRGREPGLGAPAQHKRALGAGHWAHFKRPSTRAGSSGADRAARPSPVAQIEASPPPHECNRQRRPLAGGTASSALVAWPATHTRRKGSSAGQTGTRGAIAARLSVGAAGQGRGTHATRGSTHQGSALVLARIATIARGGDALNDLLHAAITCTVYYMLSITWPITCRSCYMRASRFKQPLHACNGCM